MSNLQTGFNNASGMSAYPFRKDCSRADYAGNTLPDWFIVDIGVTLPAGMEEPYLQSAYIGDKLWSAVIAAGSTPVLVASAEANPLAESTAVSMTPLVPGASGRVIFGNAPVGWSVISQYTYTEALADNTRLMPSVVRTARRLPVSSIYRGAANSPYASVVAGAVTLVGQGDLVIETDSELPNNLLVRLVRNHESYLSVCDRSPDAEKSTPISSINGVKPDADGTLTVRMVAVDGGA